MTNVNIYPSLKNKHFLITGITSGIGKEIGVYLLEQGSKVLGIGRDQTKLTEDSFQSDLFSFISLNLTNVDEITNVLEDYISKEGKLDGFTHCAGIEETIPLSLYNSKKIKNIFELNVFSGIEILRLFSKKKYTNEEASIIFISSVMGELGQSGKVGYSATKASVLGVVKSASLELAKRLTRVNAISPGVVKTPMTTKLFNQIPDDNINTIKKMHPLGLGEADDIAELALFLLSNKSRWITGQNIKIDGGYSIQ